MIRSTLFFTVVATFFTGLSFCAAQPATSPTTKDDAEKALPKVLLIGDSISGGYTKAVIRLMEGKANVSRIPGNGEYTGTGLKKIDEWLGDQQWDVIHFNWGLWDMYGWQYAKEDRSPEAYEDRLEKLVTRLEKTGAKLIWATTTPVCPEAEATMLKRFKTELKITPEVEKQYLEAAERVMQKHKIQTTSMPWSCRSWRSSRQRLTTSTSRARGTEKWPSRSPKSLRAPSSLKRPTTIRPRNRQMFRPFVNSDRVEIDAASLLFDALH